MTYNRKLQTNDQLKHQLETRRALIFSTSQSHSCPYLEGKEERQVYIRLPLDGSEAIEHDRLVRVGFRRSHDAVYRPACPNCMRCIPVRIRVNKFHYSKSLKRIHKLNSNLISHRDVPIVHKEDYALFHRYITHRHDEGEMKNMTEHEYQAMIKHSPCRTELIRYYLSDPKEEHQILVASMLADRLVDGYSAVYSYFDPAYSRDSLGRFMVMDLVRLAELANQPYVYLGYSIDECRKMNYKMAYPGIEQFIDGEWREA